MFVLLLFSGDLLNFDISENLLFLLFATIVKLNKNTHFLL